METTCHDAVFGTMTYKHSWVKPGTLLLFGKEWKISVDAAAYSGKQITSEQRDSYRKFVDDEAKLLKTAEQQLKKYVKENLEELREMNPDINADKVADMVEPRTLLFKQNGTAVLLLECIWDEENGIAVELLPDSRIGAQELFL